MTQKTILFDLELTLIESWEDPTLLDEKIPGLMPWIKRQGAFKAGLLSFAVWDEKDLKKFNKNLRNPLEEHFGFQFDDSLIFLRDTMLEKTRIWERMPFLSTDDFSDFFKKRKAVEDLWLHEFQFPNTELILLDDTVPNLTVQANDLDHCRLTLVNPWTLPDQC